MRSSNHIQKLLSILLYCILFVSCSKLPNTKNIQSTPHADNPYTMPANGYLALAKNHEGEEKQSLLISASGQFIFEGKLAKSQDILNKIQPSTPIITAEKNLLQSKIYLIQEQPEKAIAMLAKVTNIHNLPVYYQIQYHEMLASAYFVTNHEIEAVHERIKLDNLLEDNTSKNSNHLALWLALTSLSEPEVNILAAESSDDKVLNGWIQLASISRRNTNTPQENITQIQKWQTKFPNHPGNQVLPDLNRVQGLMFPKPQKIALLLPLSGSLSGPGQAIRDGFMAALEASSEQYNIGVRLYDTNADNVKNLYAKAIEDGANYVVGPLAKNQVAEIAKLDHPVPTLLLNETEIKPTNNAYEFGISPTNEALQIAHKIRKKGYGHALVIAPEGTWGKEIVDTFANQFRKTGGQVIETFYFGPEDDLTTAIRDLLHVPSESVIKQRAQQNSHEPLRRQDIDVIFLVAYPTKARQIVPTLRYFYAGNIPVFATSNVYSGSINTSLDRDLNNVIFCDMPWVFHHQIQNQNWPEQYNSYNRLYALGMDAFALSSQLNKLLLFPAVGINNKSGIVYLNNGQEISRILVFGKFINGKAELKPYM